MHNKQTVYDTEDYKEYLRKRNSGNWNEKAQSHPQRVEDAELVLAEYTRRREYWFKESIAALCHNELHTYAHLYYVLWSNNAATAEDRLRKLQCLTAFSATMIEDS